LLQKYDQRAQGGFQEELEALRRRHNSFDAGGKPQTPPYISELVQVLHALYQQSNEDIRYQRGAIVELLAYEIVRPRYQPGECVSNYRFVYGKYFSDQIDVAALSLTLRRIEGYECKLKVDSIENSNCTNLACLAEIAQQQDYHTHVGIISFDRSQTMKHKLQRFQPAMSIHLYGVDNLAELGRSPFSKEKS